MKNYVERRGYLDKLLSYSDKGIIKVVIGLRRAGKSTLLEMVRDNYPKFLLSTDSFTQNRNGIVHKNVFEWLLEK